MAQGAEVNVKDNDGNTALLLACARGGTDAVACLLLDNGAYVNAKNKKGDLPLPLAKKNSLTATVKAMERKNARMR